MNEDEISRWVRGRVDDVVALSDAQRGQLVVGLIVALRRTKQARALFELELDQVEEQALARDAGRELLE